MDENAKDHVTMPVLATSAYSIVLPPTNTMRPSGLSAGVSGLLGSSVLHETVPADPSNVYNFLSSFPTCTEPLGPTIGAVEYELPAAALTQRITPVEVNAYNLRSLEPKYTVPSAPNAGDETIALPVRYFQRRLPVGVNA